MKKKIIMLSIILFSCTPTHTTETIKNTKVINIETEVIIKKLSTNDNFSIVTIDECEYVLFDRWGGESGGQAGGLTHKGNCKYCLKRK